ncbi:MAG: hypothetical protein AAF411_23700, partial [Myxococcota bacterium]
MRNLCFLTCLVALGACGGDDTGRVTIGLSFDERASTVNVSLSRDLAGGEVLRAQLRRGAVGMLDCTAAGSIPEIGGARIAGELEPTFTGPFIPDEAFQSPYNSPEWLAGTPTPEMLAEAALGPWLIDVCLTDGNNVVRQLEVDLSRALDVAGSNGKFDGDEDEVITSVGAYAAACVAEMGEIPFFERLADGDYATANCLDGAPIPMEITHEDGTVERPEGRDTSRGEEVFGQGWFDYNQCDHQQQIYDSCEPNAVDGVSNGPRVQSASNQQGTHWVLLCRKSQEEEGQYYDIAMLGTNPYTGKTCFFQNALGNRMDGQNVPHPGDLEQTEASPETWDHIWSGLQGGEGFGIDCTSCHSTDAFIGSEWISRAIGEDGRPVVPRMGVHEDFALGWADAPYDLVARDRVCQGSRCGWEMPQHLVSEEAAPCTRCHRIGDDVWARDWLRRLEPNADGTGTDDAAWNQQLTAHGLEFNTYAWMPPEIEGLDAATWHGSELGRAVDFIQNCSQNRDDPACIWEDLPREPN